jgi:tRNA threonylcarbamoyladenosine biosynthesis protein TsaE
MTRKPTEPTMEQVLVTRTAQQTVEVGRTIGRLLGAGDVLGLVGPLGGGKTQLVRGLVEGLGGDGAAVSSPTFVLMQDYPTRPPLVHIDAYRLNTIDDLATIGFDELIETAEAVVAVEWADRIEAAMPEDRLELAFDHLDIDQREVVVVGQGAWARRWEQLTCQLAAIDLSPF